MAFPVSTEKQFGFVIAYLIPGFLVVLGLGKVSPTVENWLLNPACTPSLGGFLYVVLASLLAGLFCSTVRWLVLDYFHSKFGIKAKKWEMEELSKNIDAFELIVAYHYRYYQFYGNMLVSIPVSTAVCISSSDFDQCSIATLAGALFAELLFFLGSRDSLKKYVSRSNELLQTKRLLLVM